MSKTLLCVCVCLCVSVSWSASLSPWACVQSQLLLLARATSWKAALTNLATQTVTTTTTRLRDDPQPHRGYYTCTLHTHRRTCVCCLTVSVSSVGHLAHTLMITWSRRICYSYWISKRSPCHFRSVAAFESLLLHFVIICHNSKKYTHKPPNTHTHTNNGGFTKTHQVVNNSCASVVLFNSDSCICVEDSEMGLFFYMHLFLFEQLNESPGWTGLPGINMDYQYPVYLGQRCPPLLLVSVKRLTVRSWIHPLF